MRKENKYKSKYFVVGNKEMADKMAQLAKQSYYVFDNEDGSKTYSFVKTDIILVVYRMLLKNK